MPKGRLEELYNMDYNAFHDLKQQYSKDKPSTTLPDYLIGENASADDMKKWLRDRRRVNNELRKQELDRRVNANDQNAINYKVNRYMGRKFQWIDRRRKWQYLVDNVLDANSKTYIRNTMHLKFDPYKLVDKTYLYKDSNANTFNKYNINSLDTYKNSLASTLNTNYTFK